jgi:hypothetical protein
VTPRTVFILWQAIIHASASKHQSSSCPPCVASQSLLSRPRVSCNCHQNWNRVVAFSFYKHALQRVGHLQTIAALPQPLRTLLDRHRHIRPIFRRDGRLQALKHAPHSSRNHELWRHKSCVPAASSVRLERPQRCYKLICTSAHVGAQLSLGPALRIFRRGGWTGLVYILKENQVVLKRMHPPRPWPFPAPVAQLSHSVLAAQHAKSTRELAHFHGPAALLAPQAWSAMSRVAFHATPEAPMPTIRGQVPALISLRPLL